MWLYRCSSGSQLSIPLLSEAGGPVFALYEAQEVALLIRLRLFLARNRAALSCLLVVSCLIERKIATEVLSLAH